jgi:hypothetical protein
VQTHRPVCQSEQVCADASSCVSVSTSVCRRIVLCVSLNKCVQTHRPVCQSQQVCADASSCVSLTLLSNLIQLPENCMSDICDSQNGHNSVSTWLTKCFAAI